MTISRLPAAAIFAVAVCSSPGGWAQDVPAAAVGSLGGFDPPPAATAAATSDPATPPAPAAAAGGGSLADFSSLMQLIQTTVEPTTWEALGGVSTMSPYPAGIEVDPAGLVRSIEAVDRPQNSAAAIVAMLAGGGADGSNRHWRDPAPIRCVSLRRMLQSLAGDRPDLEAIGAMAGLSRVQLVLLAEDDLILAGTVGGFIPVGGWPVDQISGLPPLRPAALAVGMLASRTDGAFGCTIDPSTEGLRRAAALGVSVVSGQTPIGTAADRLAAALGRQDVRVFGTGSSHEVAWLMVEADRHMKQLALGFEPMPPGVRDYPGFLTASAASPPTDLLLRFWFTGQPIAAAIAVDDVATVVRIVGNPMRLSGANERAAADGSRGHHLVDPLTQRFVDHFNDNFSSIRSRYPVYGALQQIYAAAAIAELYDRLLREQTSIDAEAHEVIRRGLIHLVAEHSPPMATPALVDSIAIHHGYRAAGRRHDVLIASGGVLVDSATLLPNRMTTYPNLADHAGLVVGPPERWWWNAAQP